MRTLPRELTDHPIRGCARIAASLVRRMVPSWATARARVGNSIVEADLRTALGLRLYRYSDLEPELLLVRQFLHPGDVFVDAGANIGLFTLIAADRVGPSGRVISIEPGPVRAALKRNVDLNGYTWVTIVRAALGRAAGHRVFITFEADAAGFSSYAPAEAGGMSIDVEVCRLDDIIPDDLLSRVRLVKIDIEGAEVEALLGATRLLRESSCDFLVEVEPDHLHRQGATADDLCGFFKEFDATPFDGSPNVWFARRLATHSVEAE